MTRFKESCLDWTFASRVFSPGAAALKKIFPWPDALDPKFPFKKASLPPSGLPVNRSLPAMWKEERLLCSHHATDFDFYLRRSRQIRERKALFFFLLLLLLLGGTIFKCPMYSFLRCEKKKTFFPFFSKSLSLFTPLLKRFPINRYLICDLRCGK